MLEPGIARGDNTSKDRMMDSNATNVVLNVSFSIVFMALFQFALV